MKPKQKSDGLAPRRAALHIIRDVKAGEQLGDAYLTHLPHVLERDRALTRHLAVTTLKREGQLKALIKRCLTRPMPKNARPVLDILALGVAQLFFAQVPKHAAVSTTVDLVAKDKRPAIRALKPLANAIMRRLSGDDGVKWLEKQDAVKLNTPKWVWDRWTTFYGEDKARAIINANFASAPLDLTPKTEAARDMLLQELESAKLLPTGTVRLSSNLPVSQIPGYESGDWWVQDASAYLTAKTLKDAPAQDGAAKIADLCAAPGGKAMALIAAGADVLAGDANPTRLKRVEENLKRTGLKADVRVLDPLTTEPDKQYDAVLLDAPCSSTGTIRRHPDVLRHKNKEAVLELAKLQSDLLDAATKWVRPGGWLVFSTCSLEREEGEDQAYDFLKRHKDWETVAFQTDEICGLNEALLKEGWLRVTPDLWAEDGGLDGFFIARFKRL